MENRRRSEQHHIAVPRQYSVTFSALLEQYVKLESRAKKGTKTWPLKNKVELACTLAECHEGAPPRWTAVDLG